MRDSVTSPWGMPGSTLMPSPRSGDSYSKDETWIDGVGEPKSSDFSICLEGNHLPPDWFDAWSCPSPPRPISAPTKPLQCVHIASQLSLSEPRAPLSRGLEATISQRRIQSDNSPRSSPLLLIHSIQMPVLSPAWHDIPVYRFSASLDPQTAHSSASASFHHINRGTRPVIRPLSTGSSTTKLFAPLPCSPTALPDSGFISNLFFHIVRCKATSV